MIAGRSALSGSTALTAGDCRRAMYYVYIILCANGSLYTGVTNNLERRFTEHSTKSGIGLIGGLLWRKKLFFIVYIAILITLIITAASILTNGF